MCTAQDLRQIPAPKATPIVLRKSAAVGRVSI
jgi:hypothetical protein